MISPLSNALKVYLALEPCDMRKSFNGLSEIAMQHLSEKLIKEVVFVFINKRKNRIKLLYFDGTGLWVAAKRLEAGTFSWPKPGESDQKKMKLAPEALQLLLDGVDLRGAEMRPWYQRTD